jgi:anti-anti-sigma factor
VPADPGFRGRGLDLIAALAGDADLTRDRAGTTLRFRLPPTAVTAAAPPPQETAAGPTAATLRITDAHGGRCLELAGDLDLAGVEAVRPALLTELADGSPAILDLTRLGFVASIGIGLLLEAAQAPPGNDLEILLPTGGPVRRVLDLTGLTDVLRTRPLAVQAPGPP